MPPSDEALVLVYWTDRLTALPIPVRTATIEALDSLRADEDQIDANSLGEIVASDPLMTLRLMSQVAKLRGLQPSTPQTVTAALVWLGIGPFFRLNNCVESVEQTLGHHPDALQHLERQLTINQRAARLALAFATERADPDAALLHHAALLNNFSELLLWAQEPLAALQIARVQEADASVSRTEVQRQVLGTSLAELKKSISRVLSLPRILEQIESPRGTEHPSARCVEFAMRIARSEDVHGVGDRSTASGAAAESQAETLEALRDWLEISESTLWALLSDVGTQQPP